MAHLDRQTIVNKLKSANDVKIGGRYQHYKTGGIYVVSNIVVLEATDEVAVAYYGEAQPKITWVRPYADFVAKIAGKSRFSLLS